MNYVEQVIA